MESPGARPRLVADPPDYLLSGMSSPPASAGRSGDPRHNPDRERGTWGSWLRQRISRPRCKEAIWLVSAMLASLVAAAWVLKLWDAPLRVPFALGGDNPLTLSAIKGVLDNGWYFTNPSLGAPGGQQLIDFAGFGAENLQWLMVTALGLVVQSPAVLMNVYFLLGFPLVAAAGFVVLRRFHVSRQAALVAGVVFSVLPYHFWQGGEGHLMLANYFAVPAGCWLIMRALLGERFMQRDAARQGIRGWVTWSNAGVVLACILVGGSTLYYAVFTLILLVLSAVVRAARVRSWRGLVPGAGAFAGVGLILAVNLSPALLYRMANGANAALAVRTPNESEVYSFSLIQLLLPIPGHRVGVFADAQQRWASATMVHGEGGIQLGLLLAVTFVVALVAIGVWALGTRHARGAINPVVGAASVGAVLAFLLGTFGGISSVIAVFVSPQIRDWSRLGPFVAFFCLILLALALDWVSARLRVRTGGAWAGGVVLAVVAVFGVLDQTSAANVPQYAATAADWNMRSQFVARIEHSVAPGATILQLPFLPFPESPGLPPMGPYDPLAGYIHSDNLRWTFGAIKGRPGDWTDEAATLPPAELIRAAAAAGFAGVYVDRGGYADQGKEADADLQATIGSSIPPITSEGGRFAFYSLAPLAKRLHRTLSSPQVQAMGRALITPVAMSYGRGFYPEESDPGHRWRWASRVARVMFQNPATSSQRMRFEATLNGSPGSMVRVMYRGRTLRQVRLNDGTARVALTLSAPNGESTLVFTTNGDDTAVPPDTRHLRLQFVDPSATNTALGPA